MHKAINIHLPDACAEDTLKGSQGHGHRCIGLNRQTQKTPDAARAARCAGRMHLGPAAQHCLYAEGMIGGQEPLTPF